MGSLIPEQPLCHLGRSREIHEASPEERSRENMKFRNMNLDWEQIWPDEDLQRTLEVHRRRLLIRHSFCVMIV